MGRGCVGGGGGEGGYAGWGYSTTLRLVWITQVVGTWCWNDKFSRDTIRGRIKLTIIVKDKINKSESLEFKMANN